MIFPFFVHYMFICIICFIEVFHEWENAIILIIFTVYPFLRLGVTAIGWRFAEFTFGFSKGFNWIVYMRGNFCGRPFHPASYIHVDMSNNHCGDVNTCMYLNIWITCWQFHMQYNSLLDRYILICANSLCRLFIYS